MASRYKQMYRQCLHWNRILCLVFAISLYCMCSTLHFIYTSPGKANVYLYRFQRMVYLQRNYQHEEVKKLPIVSIPYIPYNFQIIENKTCPERFPEMTGKITVNMSEITLDDVNANYSGIIEAGGRWFPKDCIPKWNVGLLIPFRNRHEHLPILLRHILPMLIKQHLQFTIYVINQAGDNLFNRAMLLNVGFVEALKHNKHDCFIFHDVDHIPENNRNYYGCSYMPRRFRELLDIYDYRLEYSTFFGGVSGVTTMQFQNVNGFSNQFWGWGGEDDDFYLRLKHYGYNISSPPLDYGRYRSIKRHHRQERQDLNRFSLLKSAVKRNFIDGLNSLHYIKPTIEIHSLFTNISVDLHPVKNVGKFIA